MGQQETDTETAAARLHELLHYRQRPVQGPEGHSYTAFRARTPPAAAPLPYDADVVDHIDNSIAEVAAVTRALNPQAGPMPQRAVDAYAWCRERTQNAPEAEQLRRDAMEYRHYLEHAIAAGDHRVVRPHRCPACRTLGGLFWPQGVRNPKARATCVNVHCAKNNDGIAHRWTLAQLAYEHVLAERMLRECAT